MSGSTQELTEADLGNLAGVFREFDGVMAVYLFGSLAEGKARPDSDLDLAVVPRDSETRACKLDILTALTKLGFDSIDLVFLDTGDLFLSFQAVRHNRLVYAAPEFDHGSYFSLALRQYFDFEPYLRVQQAASARRLAGG